MSSSSTVPLPILQPKPPPPLAPQFLGLANSFWSRPVISVGMPHSSNCSFKDLGPCVLRILCVFVHYMTPLWNLGLHLVISHIKIFVREHFYSKELKKIKTIINGCTSVQVRRCP